MTKKKQEQEQKPSLLSRIKAVIVDTAKRVYNIIKQTFTLAKASAQASWSKAEEKVGFLKNFRGFFIVLGLYLAIAMVLGFASIGAAVLTGGVTLLQGIGLGLSAPILLVTAAPIRVFVDVALVTVLSNLVRKALRRMKENEEAATEKAEV